MPSTAPSPKALDGGPIDAALPRSGGFPAVQPLRHLFIDDVEERIATRTWGWICWMRSLSDVAETWWDAGGIFACPDTDSFSARCQNREGHSRSQYKQLNLRMSLFCLLRVWLFALGRVLTRLDIIILMTSLPNSSRLVFYVSSKSSCLGPRRASALAS